MSPFTQVKNKENLNKEINFLRLHKLKSKGIIGSVVNKKTRKRLVLIIVVRLIIEKPHKKLSEYIKQILHTKP